MKKKRSNKTEGLTSQGLTEYPDILDKLTDPVWRARLEKICHAFRVSHHPDYTRDVFLGDIRENPLDLETVCDLLEVTG